MLLGAMSFKRGAPAAGALHVCPQPCLNDCGNASQKLCELASRCGTYGVANTCCNSFFHA